MINEHCRIYNYKVTCIYKFSAILKILKSARRSELTFSGDVTPRSQSHTTSTFFLALASERLGLGCEISLWIQKTSERLWTKGAMSTVY
jgi:hypothetical protein